MEFYHIEPQIGFTHVLKAYTDVDHFIELQLMPNHTPLDCSAAIGVRLPPINTSWSPKPSMSQMDKSILKINFKGIPVGGYRVPITVAFPDRNIVFGSVTVFVSDTTRSDDIAVFHQYPDTEEETIEWKASQGIVDDETEDDGTVVTPVLVQLNVKDYDVVFIGYPIWWGVAPRVVNTFIESVNLEGKTVIPFATSGGSGIGSSVSALRSAYPKINWQSGRLLNSERDMREWLSAMGY